jgi:recombination protein RecA
MASAKKTKLPAPAQGPSGDFTPEDNDFVQDLIKDLNKEFQQKIAWNLSSDQSPTHVKRWISTGSRLLDLAIKNAPNGGLPEGRIVEIYGPPSIGKSHIACQIAKATQQMGGIVVYIDTENATNPENLKALGVDVSKRFIYCDPQCIEDVFSVIESTIEKAKSIKKDIPISIFWDSLAATPAKAELLGDYDKETIGLAARTLSKGFRKVTSVIGNNNVLLVVLNQIRTKIGVMYGDPMTTPGGLSLPFHASVRISLTGGSKIDNGNEEMIGINVIARTTKNKVARPFRKVQFRIHFGVGIIEHEEIFDVVREYCSWRDDHKLGMLEKNGKLLKIEGTSAWKTLTVVDSVSGEVEIEKKFTKSKFDEIIADPAYSQYVDDLLEAAMTQTVTDDDEAKLEGEKTEGDNG